MDTNELESVETVDPRIGGDSLDGLRSTDERAPKQGFPPRPDEKTSARSLSPLDSLGEPEHCSECGAILADPVELEMKLCWDCETEEIRVESYP